MNGPLGDVQYIGGLLRFTWLHHEYIGVFNINQRLLSICSPTWIMISPDILLVSPTWIMTFLRYTKHPPMKLKISLNVLMDPPDVLKNPRCTEHPPMYWTHIIQGECGYFLMLSCVCFGLLYIFVEFCMGLLLIHHPWSIRGIHGIHAFMSLSGIL